MPGDGLLTYDNVNKREWLDLTETDLLQFPGGSGEKRFQNVLAQTGPGGLFAGFAVAKSPDIRALAISGGIDVSSFDFMRNEVPTANIIELLGVTDSDAQGSKFAVGYLDEVIGQPPFPVGAVFFVRPFSELTRGAGLAIGSNDLLIHSHNGVMLYRQAVPEPRTLLSAIFAIVTVRVSQTWMKVNVGHGRRDRELRKERNGSQR